MKKKFYTLATLATLLLIGCTNAGKDQTVTAGTKVTLDGSGAKTDLGGTITRYTWGQLSQNGIQQVHIFDKYSQYASFIAPSLKEKKTIKFKLTTIESYNCKNDQDSSCNHHRNSAKVSITIKASADANKTTNSSTNNNTNNNNNQNSSYTVAVAGTITTTAKAGIAGATVNANGKIITTRSNGGYNLSQTQTSDRVVINASHPDYFDNSHVALAQMSNNFTQDIKLGKVLASQTFNSGEGTTLTQGTASIEIPADAKYLDENNKKYTGDVIANMSYYDVRNSEGRSLLPGNYEGSDGSGKFPLYSYSFMHLSFTDNAKKTLHLTSNSQVTLHFPDTKSTDNKNTIPLWSYDTSTGYWLKESNVELVNQQYTTTINTAGTYGLHDVAPFATMELCVRDASNLAIQGANITVRTGDWSYPLTQTNAQGNLTIYHVLANSKLTIKASKEIKGKTYTKSYSDSVILREGETRKLTDCIELGEALVVPSPSPSVSPSPRP